MEDGDISNLKTPFGKDFKLTGFFQGRYIGGLEKGLSNYVPYYNFSIPNAEFRMKGDIYKHLGYNVEVIPSKLVNIPHVKIFLVMLMYQLILYLIILYI